MCFQYFVIINNVLVNTAANYVVGLDPSFIHSAARGLSCSTQDLLVVTFGI